MDTAVASGAPQQDLSDGSPNPQTLICQRCGAKILLANSGNFIRQNVSVRVPFPSLVLLCYVILMRIVLVDSEELFSVY